MSSRIIHLALPLIVFATLLGGCGGGGAGGARASDGTTSEATTAGSNAVSGTTPIAAASPVGPVASASPSPAPVVPDTPFTGTGRFRLQIKDQSNLAVTQASVSLVATSAKQGTKMSAYAKEQSTDGDGVTTFTELNTDVYYQCTVSHSLKRTLRTTLLLDKNSSLERNVIITAPDGQGLVSFVLPTPLQIHAHSDYKIIFPAFDLTQRYTMIDWLPSTNAGFASYTVVEGDPTAQLGPESGAIDTISVPYNGSASDFLYPADLPTPPVNYVYSKDTVVVDGQPSKYRVYEKVLLPELGTFAFVGSNEVTVGFPTVWVTPNGDHGLDDKEAPVDTSITLKFDQPMVDPQTLTYSKSNFLFGVQSRGPASDGANGYMAIGGSGKWTDSSTYIFKPTDPLRPSRTISVNIFAESLNGDLVGSSTSFVVTSGYTQTWVHYDTSSLVTSIFPTSKGVVYSTYNINSLDLSNLEASFQPVQLNSQTGPNFRPNTAMDCIDDDDNVWVRSATTSKSQIFPYNPSTALFPEPIADYPNLPVAVQSVVTGNVKYPSGVAASQLHFTTELDNTNPTVTLTADPGTGGAFPVGTVLGFGNSPGSNVTVASTFAAYTVTSQVVDSITVSRGVDLQSGRIEPVHVTSGKGTLFTQAPRKSVNTVVALAPGLQQYVPGFTFFPDFGGYSFTLGSMYCLELDPSGPVPTVPLSGAVGQHFVDAVNADPLTGNASWRVGGWSSGGAFGDAWPPGALSFGSGDYNGSGYSKPSSVAYDSSKKIYYVADNGFSRVQVYKGESTEIDQHYLGFGNQSVTTKGYVGSIGGPNSGGGYGLFAKDPGITKVFVDGNHFVYVLDPGNKVIQKFAGVGAVDSYQTPYALGTFITQITGRYKDLDARLGACVSKTAKSTSGQYDVFFISDYNSSATTPGGTSIYRCVSK